MMRLGYELTIEQSQKLSMTPELIQAIQILQLNQQELLEYVQKELLENPVLETENAVDDEQIDLQSIVLRKAADEWQDFHRTTSGDDEPVTLDQLVSEKRTLEDFLMRQLHVSGLNERKMNIGRYIIESIDDNGYLGVSVEEIAKACKTEVEKVEAVLAFVQTFDPPGVAARDLKECLLIQLTGKGLLTENMETMILHMLEDVGAHRYAKIGKRLHLRVKHVQQMVDILRSLEPKPGRAFSSEETVTYVTPDVFVEESDRDFVVVSNEDTTPRLFISSYYRHLHDIYRDEELQKYLGDRINAALWLIKSIEQRRETIYSVAKAIVEYQQGFFHHGEKAMKPLTLHQIAEIVGVHESTVSRTINGKYLQCSRGVFELKYFFNRGIEDVDGHLISSSSVKTLIRDMIEKEDTRHPLSDQEMSVLLAAKGIAVSRRTVAKYRESMQILSSSKRRRF